MTRIPPVLFAIACVVASPVVAFAEPSKEACLDSHSRGQDAREQNKLSLARKLFLTCAQPSCPALVQGDCARYADDLTRMQPTLSFVARDGSGADLPDTTVYVDDVLVATRLDDGKTYDVDPGKHTIKFQHGGKDQVVTVVVGTGEKGRTVSANFGGGRGGSITGIAAALEGKRKEPPVHHPTGSKVLLGAGAVLIVGGGALGIVGLTRIPSNCSLGSHQCAAPPGDPSFDEASSATGMVNLGFIAAGVGAATLVGGYIWYRRGARSPAESSSRVSAVAPWVTPDGAGFAIAGRL